MKNFRKAQRARDSMEPPFEDHDVDAMDDHYEEAFEEPDDTDWDAIDYGDFYDGTGQ